MDTLTGLIERVYERVATPFALWRQRRHAAGVSLELLKLLRFVAQRNPGLRGRMLYRRIVMLRLHADQATADRLLECAEESFASWPTPRDLKFADVVHWLAIEEFLAAHPGVRWTQAQIGRVVARRIPRQL